MAATAVKAEKPEKKNLKKSIYGININGENIKGRGCLIFKEKTNKYCLLTSSALFGPHLINQSQDISVNRYRSRWSRQLKEHHAIELSGEPSYEETSNKIISWPVKKETCTWYLKPDYETEINPDLELEAHTFCGSRDVILHFKFNDQKYNLDSVEPRNYRKIITTKTELAIGAPVMIKGMLNGVVGVVNQVENKLQPLLFMDRRPCKY